MRGVERLGNKEVRTIVNFCPSEKPKGLQNRFPNVIKMLITLCYVYLWVRFQKCYTLVIRSTVHRLCGSRSSFTFCHCAVKPEGTLQKGHQNDEQTFKPHSTALSEETVFLKLGNKAIYITEPQACDDLSKWTLLLGSSLVCGPKIENIAFIIEATSGQRVGQSLHTSNKKVLKWSDYCLPLACIPGQPYRAVAEASVDDFSRLGVAFMEDRLQMENGLVPERIVSVLLRESALRELFEKRRSDGASQVDPIPLGAPAETVLSEPSLRERERGDVPQTRGKSSLRLSAGPEPEARDQEGADPAAARRHMEGRHLHLSSCHECLELENSTILSVRYASAENIPDLPEDSAAPDGEAGEAEGFAGRSGRVDVSGKPPNVLLYTGGCEERLRQVRSVLAECVDADRYALYPLRPQQALSEPWLESAVLLVLAADEPLTPQLRQRFLAYLERGGRVLGLSSPFCPAGVRLEAGAAQRDQVCRLSFARVDDGELELSVLASGSAYAREAGDGGAGEVELWGELCGDSKDMVIVRVTHGEAGGEAILCQVRLETAPDSQRVPSQKHFDELKASNARRYEVLTELLTSLGLSCERSRAPPPSPVYVLATSEELRASFLKWLRSRVDGEGVLRAAKASLKLLSWAERQTELPEGVLGLLAEPPPLLAEPFDLQAYSLHLGTLRLGRTLLYADVTPTTMDLLEG